MAEQPDTLLSEMIAASKALEMCMARTDSHLVALVKEHEALRHQEVAAMRRVGAAFDAMSERARQMDKYVHEVMDAVKQQNPSVNN